MKDDNGRIEKIAGRILLSTMKLAKFEIDYDNVKLYDNGIYAELKGAIDYGKYNDSINGEIQNIKSIAKQLSDDIISMKDEEEQLKENHVDVDEIDTSEYRIMHDDKNKKIYLFLPIKSLRKDESKKVEKGREKYNKKGWLSDVDFVTARSEILDYMTKNIIPNDAITSQYYEELDYFEYRIYPFHNEQEMKKNEKVKFEIFLEPSMTGEHDIRIKMQLNIFYDGTMIYGKHVTKDFPFKDIYDYNEFQCEYQPSEDYSSPMTFYVSNIQISKINDRDNQDENIKKQREYFNYMNDQLFKMRAFLHKAIVAFDNDLKKGIKDYED